MEICRQFLPHFPFCLPAGGALDEPGVPLHRSGLPAVPGEVVRQEGTAGGQSVTAPAAVSEGAHSGQVGGVVQTVDRPGLLARLNLLTAGLRVSLVLPLEVVSIDAVLQNVAETEQVLDGFHISKT